MSDRAAQRLQKTNQASKRGITIRYSHMSLQDMIIERGDEYPSVSHLDSFDCNNKFHEIDMIRDYNKMYRVKAPYRLIPAGPRDRSCHWRPDALCIYKDAIVAGVRFPFHDFIPKLLADFKNSSAISLGWVYINHRHSTPPIFHPKSIPDNNPKWKNEFMYLVWEGGDWGTLFRRSFSRVSDGSPNDIVLNDEEAYAYAELTKDNYATLAWELLDEFQLKSLVLSSVSDKAAAFINKSNEPLDGETARMKRARLGVKDHRAASGVPAFLRPHEDTVEEVEAPASAKSSVWRPNWGIRKKDTVVGVSKHASEWSYHSLTPCDYKDFVSNSTLEGVEHAGAQAIADADANFQGASLRSPRRRKGRDDFIDEYLDSQEYKDLIGKHDKLIFPVQFTKGWDDALAEVLEKMPGSLIVSDFPSPYAPTPLEVALVGEDDMEEDDMILDLGHSSPPGQIAGANSAATRSGSGSDSEEEEADTGDKGGDA
ncbi:hypothetical protein POM88_010032 [Heracleum sosnowskyi]|uniref:Uncharacterized protein n=1 Tax=Heracleum sosnowskyi TaxID=360622 RepID=A0AAD8JB13_9APIA|nr:hypothetical protein POM88_010032 [Heracleum sosnowskyi]